MSTPQGPQDPQQPGYGYPPAQPGYGYGYPPPQEGYPPQPYLPIPPEEPDWLALAAQQEAAAKRRKRLVIIGSVLGGAALLAGAVFVAANVAQDKDSDTVASPSTSPSSATSSAAPSPSATGGATSSADPAATMRGSDLFAAATLPVNGEKFVRKSTSHETPCWKATENGLGAVVDKNHCTQVMLATYTSGSDSVTVGVMVFPSAADAKAAEAAFKGRITAVGGKSGVPDFCGKVSCAVTHAVHDRFLYSTTAGPNSGSAGDGDSGAIAAGQGIAAYSLSRLIAMD
ncbi:hypothetical protein OG607_20325 [Streptomyces sp. NBC_01537]|uniref:hypothetical protein n=1 Tax=Streptomyces sp. NBC_01537 TaxID=2903896 RepID=UPI00386611C9